VGKRVQANLIAPSKLNYSTPYVHTLPLFVVYNGGHVRFEPVEKKSAPKGPMLSDQKDAIVRKANAFFGLKSAQITGSEGKYKLSLTPTDSKIKGVFRSSSVSADTLKEIETQLDLAIGKVKAHLGLN
jgi:hypothetical protein